MTINEDEDEDEDKDKDEDEEAASDAVAAAVTGTTLTTFAATLRKGILRSSIFFLLKLKHIEFFLKEVTHHRIHYLF
jgi:hypothetical protein